MFKKLVKHLCYFLLYFPIFTAAFIYFIGNAKPTYFIYYNF